MTSRQARSTHARTHKAQLVLRARIGAARRGAAFATADDTRVLDMRMHASHAVPHQGSDRQQ